MGVDMLVQVGGDQVREPLGSFAFAGKCPATLCRE
jgi:hypothetical protein